MPVEVQTIQIVHSAGLRPSGETEIVVLFGRSTARAVNPPEAPGRFSPIQLASLPGRWCGETRSARTPTALGKILDGPMARAAAVGSVPGTFGVHPFRKWAGARGRLVSCRIGHPGRLTPGRAGGGSVLG